MPTAAGSLPASRGRLLRSCEPAGWIRSVSSPLCVYVQYGLHYASLHIPFFPFFCFLAPCRSRGMRPASFGSCHRVRARPPKLFEVGLLSGVKSLTLPGGVVEVDPSLRRCNAVYQALQYIRRGRGERYSAVYRPRGAFVGRSAAPCSTRSSWTPPSREACARMELDQAEAAAAAQTATSAAQAAPVPPPPAQLTAGPLQAISEV